MNTHTERERERQRESDGERERKTDRQTDRERKIELTWLLSISPEQKYSAGIIHRVDMIRINLLK